MLEQVLRHIHNRFEYKCIQGKFSIVEGVLTIEDATVGQYLWFEGSLFNDGLHQYPMCDLIDETFDGKIYLLAVPFAVVVLSEEIKKWVEDNSKIIDSPYQSESFGGYSYTKMNFSNNGEFLSGWQLQFRDQLNQWRKMGCNNGW